MNDLIDCVDRHGKIHQIPSDQVKERLSVYGIIVRDNAILLSPEPGGYDLPGGGIEVDETEATALIREVREETGYIVSTGELVARRENYFFSEKRGAMHSKLAYYRAIITGGELSDEYLDEGEKGVVQLAEWVDLNQIDRISFSSSIDVRLILKEVLGL